MEHGACLQKRNSKGETALHAAMRQPGSTSLAALLAAMDRQLSTEQRCQLYAARSAGGQAAWEVCPAGASKPSEECLQLLVAAMKRDGQEGLLPADLQALAEADTGGSTKKAKTKKPKAQLGFSLGEVELGPAVPTAALREAMQPGARGGWLAAESPEQASVDG